MSVTKEKALQIIRHTVALVFVGFFIASFFIGATLNPEFIDIAKSPYGLFAYFIITSAAIFIPSFTTLPLVITATFIWGPWLAGTVALVGWTIAGIGEYAAGYYAKDSILTLVGGGNNLDEKIEKMKEKMNFWHLIIARTVVPSFIFGIVRASFWRYVWATVIVFIPWAAAGAIGGELIKPYIERVRPWIIGLALIIALFVIDYFFIKRDAPEPPKPQLPTVIEKNRATDSYREPKA